METNSYKALECLFHPSGKTTHAGKEAELTMPFFWGPHPDTKWGAKSSSGSKQAMFSPAAGVTAGDIGPKMNFEHIDNGYLLLKNVRVPRENMLSKFCEVCVDSHHKLAVRFSFHSPWDNRDLSKFGTKNLPLSVSKSLWGFIKGRRHLNPKWKWVSRIPHSEAGDHEAGRTYLCQKQ